MLHSGSSPAFHIVHKDVQFSGNIYAHLKFIVYGCEQTDIHVSYNGVPLVWGLLRLAPIMTFIHYWNLLIASTYDNDSDC